MGYTWWATNDDDEQYLLRRGAMTATFHARDAFELATACDLTLHPRRLFSSVTVALEAGAEIPGSMSVVGGNSE
jgi:hypothetical protein